MVNVIFHTIRNCSERKDFAPSGSKELLAIRRMFSLVDMITTNTKISNCPNVFKIGMVWQ